MAGGQSKGKLQNNSAGGFSFLLKDTSAEWVLLDTGALMCVLQ